MARNIRKKVDHAKGAGQAFVGVEVAWRFGWGGKDATAVSIPRSLVKEAFGKRWAAYVPDLDVEDIMKASVKRGWQHALGLATKVTAHEMEKHNKDTIAAWGLYYKQALEGESGDDICCAARVRIEGGQAVCRPPEGKIDFGVEQPDEDCKRYGEAVAEWINERMTNCVNRDLSDALSTLCVRLGGMPRHPNGGVYLMPPSEATDEFLGILERLQELTGDEQKANQFFADPALQFADPRDCDDLNARTFARIVQHGIEAEIARLEKQLAQMVEKQTGREKTYEKRAAQCAELIARADGFALVLADKLESIKTNATKLRGEFGDAAEAAAKLKAEGEQAFAGAEKQTKRAARKPKAKPAPKPEQPAEPQSALPFSRADIDALFGG